MAKKSYTEKKNKLESILNFEDLRKNKTKANSFLITDSLVRKGVAFAQCLDKQFQVLKWRH